jgi:two-component system, chemotaxis family, response regulator WspR
MRRVAIIDDMLPNALLLKGYMKRLEDVEASTFTDPNEALARCTQAAPDLVLLDYHMPQMNGIEFLTKFRGVLHLKDVPIVMITGEEKKEALYEALEAGANDFLRKPVDDIELITRARNLLELRARQIDLAKANTQLYVLATTDQLTNLKNRRYFLEKLAIEVERSCRYARPCSVAIVDADRFKTINDTYGHDVGDKVLQALSDVLIDELRGVDQIGRLGGEEFAILFLETEKSKALEVCRRLLSQIRETKVMAEGGQINFTVSAGLTEIIPSGDEADAVLKRADRALYRAKELGRDRCEIA